MSRCIAVPKINQLVNFNIIISLLPFFYRKLVLGPSVTSLLLTLYSAPRSASGGPRTMERQGEYRHRVLLNYCDEDS